MPTDHTLTLSSEDLADIISALHQAATQCEEWVRQGIDTADNQYADNQYAANQRDKGEGGTMSKLTDLLGCHESWEQKILDVIERDHPGLLKEAVDTVVSENARANCERWAAEAGMSLQDWLHRQGGTSTVRKGRDG